MNAERKFVDLNFLQNRYGKSRATIYRWMKKDGFPPPKIKPGLWDLSQVVAWEDKDNFVSN